MHMSEHLHTVMVVNASIEEKKIISFEIDSAGMWWDHEKSVIPDLTDEQLKLVENMLEELQIAYLEGPTTDGS